MDASEFIRFGVRSRAAIERGMMTYFQRGGDVVTPFQVKEGVARFGVETAESRMQTVDPERPKGGWTASVRMEIDQARREATVGPREPYAGWVEKGSQSPAAPTTHRSSSFIGHKPVARATEKARTPLASLARAVFGDAIRGAA